MTCLNYSPNYKVSETTTETFTIINSQCSWETPVVIPSYVRESTPSILKKALSILDLGYICFYINQYYKQCC